MSRPGQGRTAVQGGTVVTPRFAVPDGRVVLDGETIERVDASDATPDGAELVDATDRYVLPGLVDLHGDDVETHLFPRRNARVRTEAALSTCDRANLAAGITTKFHAIAFEDEPDGDRSIDCALELAGAIADRQGPVDGRVHARCELNDPRSVETVVDLATAGVPDLVSVMTHGAGEGQFDDAAEFAAHYSDGGTVDPAIQELIERRRAVPDETVDERMRRVASAARESDAVVASHDDATPEAVETSHHNGVTVTEYPVSMAAARRATELGNTTVMGAPNLVRGGSLWNNLDAPAAIEAGVVDALCSDYHPHSLLAAAFVDTGEPLATRVRRVSSAPARATGLEDRGRLVPGARADLLVVDPEPVPTVERAFVRGREVFHVADPPEPDAPGRGRF